MAWHIENADVSVAVDPIAGMMAPVVFRLPDGRRVQPFKISDWSERPEAAALPPIMKHIKGDFVCVPYGALTPPANLPDDWKGLGGPQPAFSDIHGCSANRPWSLVEQAPGRLRIGIDYPADHPIRRVERTIAIGAGASVDVELTIVAREATSIALGTHPLFALSDKPGDTRIEIDFAFGRTFPVTFIPNVSLAAQNTRFASLEAVPKLDGTTMDCSALPLPFTAEEVVQLCGAGGRLLIHSLDERFTTEFTWDAADLPSCGLWFSNGGRKGAPFDGRLYVLGVEPVAAAFGLTSAISADLRNPIARDGVKTAVDLKPEQPWTTRYRFSVLDLSIDA